MNREQNTAVTVCEGTCWP